VGIKFRNINVVFPTEWTRGAIVQVSYWLAIVLLSYICGRFVLNLVAVVDYARLEPILVGPILQALPLTLLLYFLGVIIVSSASRMHGRVRLFTAAFFLRVVVGIVLALVFQYDDERGLHAAGIEQAYGLFSWKGGSGYYHLVNILYAIFGPNLLLPKVVNALLGSLLAFMAYDLGCWMFSDPKVGWRAFLFTAFLPPLVVFSAVNLKEIATAFLLVLILWLLLVPQRSGIWKITGAIGSTVVLYWLRGAPWAAIATAGVITYVILGETWSFTGLLRMRSWPRILLSVAVFVLFVSPFLIEPITQIVLSRLTQETYFIKRFTGSKATVMHFVDTGNPISPGNLGILFLRGLFSPSPLRFVVDYGPDTMIEATNMVVWYLLFPFAMVGFLAGRGKGGFVACGVMALGVLALTSMGIMVGSDPYRQRTAMLGLMFILAAGGLNRESSRGRRWVLCLWAFGALAFTGLWLGWRI
jgi:hypothetical protein